MSNVELLGTRVVNIRTCHGKPYEYIGRGSLYGNPFTHLTLGATKARFQVTTREESIDRFEQYVLDDAVILHAVERLRGRNLGCYCDPLPCHGSIYVLLVATYDRMRKIYGREPRPDDAAGREEIRKYYYETKELVAKGEYAGPGSCVSSHS